MREIKSAVILLSSFANSIHAIPREGRAFGGPLMGSIVPRTCENGGSWNHSLKRCDCQSGFTGKKTILSEFHRGLYMRVCYKKF